MAPPLRKLSLLQEIFSLNRKIKIKKKELDRQVEKPYCLAPWKYLFVRQTGNIRQCPYYHFESGNITAEENKGSYNDHSLVEIRKALVTGKNMPKVCMTCSDTCHREYDIEGVENVCRTQGVRMEQEKDR